MSSGRDVARGERCELLGGQRPGLPALRTMNANDSTRMAAPHCERIGVALICPKALVAGTVGMFERNRDVHAPILSGSGEPEQVKQIGGGA